MEKSTNIEEYKIRRVSDKKVMVENIPIKIFIKINETLKKCIISEKEYVDVDADTDTVFKKVKEGLLLFISTDLKIMKYHININ